MVTTNKSRIHPKLLSTIASAEAQVRDARGAVAYYDDYAATLMAVPRERLRAAIEELEATKRRAEVMPRGVRLPEGTPRVEPSRWCRSKCGAKGNRWTNCAHDGEHWYWFADAEDAILFKLTFGAAG